MNKVKMSYLNGQFESLYIGNEKLNNVQSFTINDDVDSQTQITVTFCCNLSTESKSALKMIYDEVTNGHV